MGFEFKPKLSAILAAIHGASVGLDTSSAKETSQQPSYGSPYPQA